MRKNRVLEIVPTDKSYGYTTLMQNIQKLQSIYPFLEVGKIGYSVLGKPLPYLKIGNGEKQVLYHGSIHANEWIVSVLLMKFIEDFCIAYDSNTSIYGYSARELWGQVSLYIIPMVNPDGVDLVTHHIDVNSNIYRNFLEIASNFSSIPFPDGWKANFNGESLINFHLKCCINRISL